MTPAIPAAVMTSASAAKSPSSVVVRRGGASDAGTDVVERPEPMDRLVAIRRPDGLADERHEHRWIDRRADGPVGRNVRHLAHRRIDFVDRLERQLLSDVGDDADDR